MNKIKLCFLSFLFLSICAFSFAQTGTIRGLVIDENTGDPIMFGNVLVSELGTGTVTDLDGKFSIDLPVGEYTLEFSYLGYATLKVSGVKVIEGKVEVIDISIKEDSQQLEEVVVVSEVLKNTSAAISRQKMKSPNLIDGISSQSFSKMGDSDAAAAIQRVPGVSIAAGKYVFVRGLGDRYTRTILNGLDIPGLDPDKNAVQMDIFPSNLIDNIIVYKTYTPDLPGDFTGGMVDINTKDFPETFTANVSVGLSYNPDMHFKNNFISYEGGKLDWLGMDDGTRAAPFHESVNPENPAIANGSLTSLTTSFNRTMAVKEENSLPNYNLAFSMGNQINKQKFDFGYNFALNYRSETTFYEEAIFNDYTKDRNSLEILDLDINRSSTGSIGEKSNLWSALGGVALKFEASKLSFNILRIQNGVSKAGQFENTEFEDNPAKIFRQNLEYQQRAITTASLIGKHSLKNQNINVSWKLANTISNIEEPDIRQTPFELTPEGDFLIDRSIGAVPTRTFRNLTEINYNAKLDLEKVIEMKNGRDTKIKVGAFDSYKERDYSIINYVFPFYNPSGFEFSGDPDQLFEVDNFWTPANNSGTYVEGQKEPANEFSARQNILSAYIMNEMPINSRLKLVYGVRMEHSKINFTGQNNLGDKVLNDSTIMNNMNFLPAVNAVYNLTEKSNLRASFSQTVARPTFKEKSLVQIQDFISGRTFLGNLDLEQSNIFNYDLRFEKFFKGSDLISVSTFYKHFNNPIEVVAYNETNPNNVQAKNVDEARVLGLELEINKGLDFISEKLKSFYLQSNFTFNDAKTKMSAEEYDSRIGKARPNEDINQMRAMVGQSPYVINAAIGYQNSLNGIDCNLSYNVQGKRLAIAGIGIVPDVYEQSFPLLNFKASKRFGKDNVMKVSLSASNLLGSKKSLEYESYGADKMTYQYQTFNPGRTFSIGFNYKLK